MNYYSITAAINTATILSLGCYAYFKNRRNLINKTFFISCLSIALWTYNYFLWQISPDKYLALFYCRALMVGTLIIPPCFLLFVSTLTNCIKRELKVIVIGYILCLIFMLFNLGPFLVKGVSPKLGFKYWPAPGILFPFHLIYFFTYAIYALYILAIEYKKSYPIQKRIQLKYVFIGGLLGYLGGVTNYFLWYNIPIPPIGNPSVTLYAILLTYAVVRHQLLDINIVVKVGFIYSILASCIAIIFTVSIILFEYIFKQTIGYKALPITLIVALLISIFFQPLYKWLSSVVDKLFFKGTLPQIAEELQRSEKLAALGILASGLAHEIKNPLAPIKTYIQNLPDNLNNPRYIEKIAKTIPEEVDKITDIINQLRDFAKPPPLSISKVNIHNLLDNRLRLFEQDFITKNIAVEKLYSPTLPEINADPVQLERVFINLFLNALESMQNGGRLTISTETDSSDSVLIKISDTGAGINKNDLPHIFDPFYSKGKHKGMGLGLAVAKRIIEEHQGSISVESQLGKETVFYIYIPIKI